MLFPTDNIRENVRVDLNRCFLPSNSNFIRNEFSLLWTVVCPKKTETTETETTETEKDKKKKYEIKANRPVPYQNVCKRFAHDQSSWVVTGVKKIQELI